MFSRNVLVGFLFSLAIGVMGAPAAHAGENPKIDLTADWLDGGDTVKPEHIQRLIDIAQRDPETAAVVADAENVLGVKTADELLDYVKICQSDDTALTSGPGTIVTGLANVLAWRHMVSKSVPELAGQVKRDHQAELTSALQPKEKVSKLTDGADYVTAETIVRGDICIIRSADLRLAFETFVHELTHIAHLAPRVEDDSFLTSYPTADDYVKAKLVQPGGEFEANYQGYRAAIRLAHSRSGLPQGIQDSFDDQGNLVDRQKFISFLLNDADYDSLLRRNYRKELVGLYNTLASRENFLVRVYNDRAEDTRPIYSDQVRKIAGQSEDRLSTELAHVRDLAAQYRKRMSAEGMVLRSAGQN